MKKKKTLYYLFYSLLSIFLIPQVWGLSSGYRFRTGISPLNRGFEVIGNVFNINILYTNEYVQTGFIKFMLFLVLFAVINMALKKTSRKGGAPLFDKKTAGIIAFAFSMIGVFMMPSNWLQATGSLIVVVTGLLIFLGFFIGIAYVAVFGLKNNWVQRLIGLLILLLLILIFDDVAMILGVPMVLLIREEWLRKGFGKGLRNHGPEPGKENNQNNQEQNKW
jgi:hypothetical protein